MGGKNYDEWAGRDSIFRNKLSNLRSGAPQSGQPVLAHRAGTSASEQYLQNLSADKVATPPARAATAMPTSIEDMERMALFDSVTGLFNWRYFNRTLAYELRRGERYRRPLAITLIAVDGLQTVRSQAGHDPADFILKSVVSSIETCIRDADIAARHTDSSFAVLFPETNAAGLTTVAERIRQQVRAQQVMYAMQNFVITVSIGGASFPAHAKTPEDLLARANQSLQMAIERGGDKVCVV